MKKIECSDVVKKYGGKAAVDKVTVTLETGKIYAMVGPNGSGKTTWMKMVSGLVKADSGEIKYDGEKIGTKSKKEIAYMSTEPYFYSWMKVIDAGRYYDDFFDDFSIDKYEELLIAMNIEREDKIKSLSTGMIAKMKIALTMARDAYIYLLDEPLNGIDLIAREQIIKTIIEAADENKAIIVSSHLIDELEKLCDCALFMHDGRMIEIWDVEEKRTECGKSVTDRYREIYGMGGML